MLKIENTKTFCHTLVLSNSSPHLKNWFDVRATIARPDVYEPLKRVRVFSVHSTTIFKSAVESLLQTLCEKHTLVLLPFCHQVYYVV